MHNMHNMHKILLICGSILLIIGIILIIYFATKKSPPGHSPTPSRSPGPTPGPSKSPGPTPGPSKSPGPTPGPSKSPGPTGTFSSGNGQASYTHYDQGDSPGQGSCGGCVWPPYTNAPHSQETSTYENLYKKLQSLSGDVKWTLAASAENMMGQYCSTTDPPKGSFGMGCIGNNNKGKKTANAPCGSCWELTNPKNGKKINVVIADACPCGPDCPGAQTGGKSDNSKWCRAKLDEKNSVGEYNHFDIWNGDILGFDNSGTVTFKNVPIPSDVLDCLSGCCGTWYDGDKWGGMGIGCPNICKNVKNSTGKKEWGCGGKVPPSIPR